MNPRRYYLKKPGKIILSAVVILAVFSVAFCFRDELFSIVKSLIGKNEYYTNADFGIPDCKSDNDEDGDGIDDQTDILLGAKEYVATRPVYQSKYYAGGWSDDKFGVCTDVVANALLSAGYDLQDLVDKDISAAPNEYGDDCGDRNIDFRRVRNLLVYFKRHAKSLTLDLSEIEEWQGGDIVVFEGHIGIISDRRNKKGVPYLIHHGGSNGAGCPLRPDYEEDVLENQNEILGHFRIIK